jgi:hypothetical protein
MSFSKLESTKQNADTDANAIREKEALTEITNCMSGTGFIRSVIARRVRTMHCVSTVEILYCLAEAFLCLAKASLGVGIVVMEEWLRRGCRFGEGRHFLRFDSRGGECSTLEMFLFSRGDNALTIR